MTGTLKVAFLGVGFDFLLDHTQWCSEATWLGAHWCLMGRGEYVVLEIEPGPHVCKECPQPFELSQIEAHKSFIC